MTRKDYIKLADAFIYSARKIDAEHIDTWKFIREHIMVQLRADNPRFDTDKFVSYIEGELA